jgi:hypothetical protein
MASAVAPNYDSFEACEKQRILWEKIEGSEYAELPGYKELGLGQVMAMAAQRLTHKGEYHSDFAPEGWKKYLHRRAAVAKVRLVPLASSFTGVFQGANCALLRLSLTYKVKGDRPVAPGLALKVLRDGVPSANISALVSLDGQGRDFNFFRNPMSNIVPSGDSFGQKLVHQIFKRVSPYPEELLLEHFADKDTTGNLVKTPIAPRQIFFIPNPELRFASEEHDVREDFTKIPVGTTVYRIVALDARKKDFNYSEYTPALAEAFLKETIPVADVVTTSEFVASEFGDDGIFFRHEIRSKSGY